MFWNVLQPWAAVLLLSSGKRQGGGDRLQASEGDWRSRLQRLGAQRPDTAGRAVRTGSPASLPVASARGICPWHHLRWRGLLQEQRSSEVNAGGTGRERREQQVCWEGGPAHLRGRGPSTGQPERRAGSGRPRCLCTLMGRARKPRRSSARRQMQARWDCRVRAAASAQRLARCRSSPVGLHRDPKHLKTESLRSNAHQGLGAHGCRREMGAVAAQLVFPGRVRRGRQGRWDPRSRQGALRKGSHEAPTPKPGRGGSEEGGALLESLQGSSVALITGPGTQRARLLPACVWLLHEGTVCYVLHMWLERTVMSDRRASRGTWDGHLQ